MILRLPTDEIFLMEQRPLQPDKAVLFNDLTRGYRLRSKLSDITNGLQIYEEISIVFLLCETPQAGVEVMESILRETDVVQRKNLFHKWLKHQVVFTTPDWEDALAEVLTIIQNYRLAKILGYQQKHKLEERFKPKDNFHSYQVSSVQKVLYNLCEELKPADTSKLIALIEGDENADHKYLEYKLLSWSKKRIINLGNDKPIDLHALLKPLEYFNLRNFMCDIEIIVEKANCHNLRNKYKTESELAEYYEIYDVKKLGLCVIINQKNFTSSTLPKRQGTDKDAERLIEVFTAFGFDIKLHSNLSFIELMKTLQFYAKTMNKSVSLFVLIILSHGSENIIYTSDSLPVDMNAIEMIFQAEVCLSLIGKPKIFIVQSCQGEKWQKVVQDFEPELQSDNPIMPITKQSQSLGPQKGDSMIAWSTVQGFASFRDKYKGSWYIQELCNELWKFGDTFDLVEILTKVNNNLRSKVYSSQFMVPSLLLSLRAKVIFPKVKENFQKGRKLMLERLIFDKLLYEFLSTAGTHLLEILSRRS